MVEYRSIYSGRASGDSGSGNITPPNKPKAPSPSRKPGMDKSVKVIIVGIILTIFIILGTVAGIFFAYMQEVPEIADLRNYKPNLTTAVYDINGNLVSQLYTEQRTIVKLNQIPLYLQNAIIAKEDPRFYQHSGIDVKGIMRASINNLVHGKIVEGGSTITQQLARNLFLTKERTFTRKIKEALLSLQVEKYYTKKEILELYCNQVYFGNGAYGVEAAARTFFGKHVDELTLPESATLAALPQAPSQFNPYEHPEVATEKRNLVLEKMAELGYITPEEKEAAEKAPIELHKLEVKNAPYFVEYVRQQLETTYGNSEIYKGGLKVYTTIDSVLQDTAQEVFNARINELQKQFEKNRNKKLEYPLQGALIAIDPHTGYIKAMIGGIDYSKSEFNRAVQSKRQPGSAFKPIVYTSAIDNGFRVSDVILDSPIVFKNDDGSEWKPENVNGKFSGPTILLNGLTHSKNVVTVKLENKIGIDTVAKYARRLGIKSPLIADLTMGLGTSSLSLLELTNSFCTFANGGMYVEPLSILSVNDSGGKVLEQHSPKLSEAIPETTAYIITFMLENVINRGTAQTIRNMGYNGICAGKTGTTNDFTDAWFIGFTPDIVVGVWIGFDTKEPLGKNMTGGVIAAPLWAEFMMNAFPNQNQEFPVPDNIIFKKICSKTGMLATKYCPNPIDAPFVEGTEPHENCNLHSGVEVNNFLNQDLEQGSGATDNFTSDEESGENTTGTPVKGKAGKPAKVKKPHEETEDEDNLAF